MSIINNEYIVIFLNILWGFALAMMFRPICNSDECKVIMIPDNEVEDRTGIIYKYNDKCISFVPELVKCTNHHLIS